MLVWLRDWIFPKVTLVPLEYDDEGYLVCFDGARKHKTIRMDGEEYTFGCQYNLKDPFISGGRYSGAFPPLHFHRRQAEFFKVIQGRVCYVLDGKEGVALPGSIVDLPEGQVHTFWCDPTSEEDVIMEFTARPGKGVDEQNINSAYGIFNSHFVAKKPVSFLQFMVIWDEADSAPGNMPKPLAIIVTYLFGRVIGRLAGFKGTHAIFTESQPPTGKL